MIRVALADIAWNRRRYTVSVIGTALVFAVSLAVTGVAAAFTVEVDRTLDAIGATSFVVPRGVSGPLTGSQPFPADRLPDGAEPMGYQIQTADPDEPRMVAVFGLAPGPDEPTVTSGSQLHSADDVLVGRGGGWEPGDHLEIGGRSFEVAGTVEHLSLNAGMPGVVMSLATFQETILGGLPLVTAGVVHGPPPELPAGFALVDRVTARDDTLRILEDAAGTIDLVKVLLWIVAVLIVGSVLYVSVIERTRDLAVFRAIGSGSRRLGGVIAVQAATLSLTAAVLGVGLANVLAPLFPMQVELSVVSQVLLPVVALGVAAIGGLVALRRALSVQPALAFGAGS